jgi:cysteine-rich repeat protein
MGCATTTGCGDGDVNSVVGEECDDGNQNDEDDCTADCRINICGDGHRDMQGPETEDCDVTGAPDTADCDGSSMAAHACTTAVCGDGYTNGAAGEVCDDGNTVSGDGCKADCSSLEVCGNDLLDSHLPGTMNCNTATMLGTNCPEVCDDDNTTAGDGCSPNCLSDETCGNGIRDASGGPGNPPEQCDDGDPNDATCSDDCQGGVGCGNGLVELLVGEQCDNGMMGTHTSDCDNDCSLPRCGDNLHNMAAG